MRAEEIYQKLKTAQIDGQFGGYFPSDGVIQTIPELRNRLEALEGIPGFEKEEKQVHDSIIFRTASARTQIQPQEWYQLRDTIYKYQIRLNGLYDYLKAMLTLQDSKAVFFKLPSLTEFRDAIKFQDEIATAIEQLTFNEKIKGQLKIKSWEGGSLWLELIVGESAVLIIGSAAWAAAVVYKKVQEGKVFAEFVSSLKAKNELSEAFLEATKTNINTVIEAEAQAIASAHLNGTDDRDAIERIKHTIKIFSELIHKGGEIHPALAAPENVKNLFPDFLRLDKITSNIKLLQKDSDVK